MIVLDLDDTLLKNDGTISDCTKEKLQVAQEQGTKVVLASGRPTFAIEKIANELKLKKYGGYIISYNVTFFNIIYLHFTMFFMNIMTI